MLRADDPNAAAQVQAVAQGLRAHGQADAANQLVRQVERYDFDAALQTLADAASALGLYDTTTGAP